jgi:hypothetical protein
MMRSWRPPAALLVLAVALVPGFAHADDFWVDPVHGKPGNDGSSSAPWRSLQGVLDAGLIESRKWESLPYKEGVQLVPRNTGAPIKGGDTIHLRSGYHGDLRISGFYNTKDVTVVAQDGHKPRFRSVRARASSHWVFRGLHVSAEYAPSYEKTTLFDVDSHGWHGPVHDIVIEDCRLQSVKDSSRWSATDWDTLSCPGVRADGKNMIIRNNVLRNVNSGLIVAAENSLVEGNLVENFAGDGIQGLGDHSTFQYNTIKNCYDVNGNHDDGFQSWAPKQSDGSRGERVGIVVRGNTIINYEDPDQPHRGALQGIGCFGSGFVDFVIENNVVITDHGHGITLKGARDSRIVNNTVLSPKDPRSAPPRVTMTAPKDSARCEGCLIRNNLAMAFGIDKKPGMVADHNLTIRNPAKLFVDVDGYDFHLKKRSRAVNTGSPKLAPEIDIERVPRPWGSGYDIGAYEYHEGDIDTQPPPATDSRDAAVEDDVEEAGDHRPPADDVRTPPDTQAEAEPGLEAGSAIAQQDEGFGFGDLWSWGVILLAATLLFIAWRIGR